MALLAGRSLRTIIRTTQVRMGRMLGWFTQVCNGLAFAHDQGVIHRDIKPAHIFVGDFGQVVLTDWGLAKSMRAGNAPEDLPPGFNPDEVTRIGDVVGTPAYMAPEQAEGRVRQVDHRADIYALGAILYEILTGTRPYEASRSDEVLREVRRGSPEPPRQRAPHRDIPPALEAVTLKAMARDPAQRFQSALDLAANIEAQFESRGPGREAPRPATHPETVPIMRRPAAASRPSDAPAEVPSEAGSSGTPAPRGKSGAREAPALSSVSLVPDQTASDPETALAEGRAEANAWMRHWAEAQALSAEARRLFANLPPEPPRRLLGDLWRLEGQSRDALDRAAHHFVQAVESLGKAGNGAEARSASRACTGTRGGPPRCTAIRSALSSTACGPRPWTTARSAASWPGARP